MNHVPSRCEIAIAVVGALLLVFGLDCACSGPRPVTGPGSTVPVVIRRTCELPPKPVLPTAKPTVVNDDEGLLICFEAAEANALRERDAKLKQWIREVLVRCGDKGTSDAGSPDATD